MRPLVFCKPHLKNCPSDPVNYTVRNSVCTCTAELPRTENVPKRADPENKFSQKKFRTNHTFRLKGLLVQNGLCQTFGNVPRLFTER